MGINGLLGFLGRAAAPAANTLAAHNEAEQTERERLRQQALQVLAQQRQDLNDRINNAYKQSQTRAADALADQRSLPPVRAIDPNSPEAFKNRLDYESGLAKLKPTPQDPTAVHAANRDYDVKHPLPQSPTNVYLPSVDPATGQTVYSVGKSKGDPNITPTETVKPAGGPGGGSASLSAEDRQKMLNQAKLDNATMKAYEEKVMAEKKAPGTVAGLAGAAAASGGTGFGAQAMGILGNAATGAFDPDYQRYITAQRSYGRIMGNLQSKRYTDHQAEIERSISGLQGNDLAGTIRYKQQLRDASLAEPEGAAPATHQAAPKAPGGLTAAQKQRAATDPEYKAFLQSTGKLPPGEEE